MPFLLILAGLSRAEDVAVTSNLVGAAILLNGVETGQRTPATLTGVAPGPVVVSVREGCVSGSANVKVVAGQTAKVSLFAIEQGGTLLLRPTPTDALISVDGKNVKNPAQKFELQCGEHTVRAEREGYAPLVMTIQVTADDALVLPVELSKQSLASLELSVQPRTALLLLDGKEVGTDTVTLPSVKAGGHTVGAEYTGYQSVEQAITVTSDDDVAWHFELVRTATKSKSTATQIRGAKPIAASVEADEPLDDEAPSQNGDADAADATNQAVIKAAADARAKAEAEAEAKRAAEEEDENLDEAVEGEVPYYLKDDKPKQTSAKGPDAAKARSKANDDTPNKTGLRVAGGVTTGLGVLGGVGTFFLYDQANIAHDAWATKDAAAKASGDQELKQKATSYYNDVFIPKATLFYVGAAGTAALLGTGVILFVVDAPVSPLPIPGGGMLTWHGSF